MNTFCAREAYLKNGSKPGSHTFRSSARPVCYTSAVLPWLGWLLFERKRKNTLRVFFDALLRATKDWDIGLNELKRLISRESSDKSDALEAPTRGKLNIVLKVPFEVGRGTLYSPAIPQSFQMPSGRDRQRLHIVWKQDPWGVLQSFSRE